MPASNGLQDARRPLSLAFVDRELEQAYAGEGRASFGHELGRAVLVAAVLWAVAGVIVVRMSPAKAESLTTLVVSMVVSNLVARAVLPRVRSIAGQQTIAVAVNALAGVV